MSKTTDRMTVNGQDYMMLDSEARAAAAAEQEAREGAIEEEQTARIAGDAAVLAQLAPEFAEGTANTAGEYVTYQGTVYQLPAGHDVGVTWANTQKVATNLGSSISDLNRALSKTNDELFGTKMFERTAEFTSSGFKTITFYDNPETILYKDTTYRIVAEKSSTSSDAVVSYDSTGTTGFLSLIGSETKVETVIRNTADVGQLEIYCNGSSNSVTVTAYRTSEKDIEEDIETNRDNIETNRDNIETFGESIYKDILFTKTVSCQANQWQDIHIWQNPYTILKANRTYLFEGVLSNSNASANVHTYAGDTAQKLLELKGTEHNYNFVLISSELGDLYVYANAATDITISVWAIETKEIYSWSASAYGVEAFQFPFKKGKRYSVTIDFGEIITLSNFGMSISSTVNWSSSYTPITERIFKGNKIIRRFNSKDNYDYVVFKLAGITSRQSLTVTIEEINGNPHPGEIVVAASDAPYDDLMAADFVCSGNNDEYIIVFAYDYAYWSKVGTVRLTNGKYNIQSFPFTAQGVKCAIPLRSGSQAQGGKDIVIKGTNCAYGFSGSRFPNGTVLYVDSTGYNSIGSGEEVAIFKTFNATSVVSGCASTLEDFGIYIYGSQKKITAMDLIGGDRIYLNRLVFVGYTNEMIYDSDIGLKKVPEAIPVAGFTGIRMGTGSNDPIGYTFRNIGIWGFYEAFKVGGEHLLMEQCSATLGVYGYTFGNYDYGDNPNTIVHPITMINCCDERNQNFPLFKKSGWNQQITMIDFNLEQVTSRTPGETFNNYMTDETGGRVCGEITYTIMDEYSSIQSGGNTVNRKLWADGNGANFITRNAAQKSMGTTAERLTYAPNYHQQYYDTDLDKLVICIDPENKTWVDVNGTVVD